MNCQKKEIKKKISFIIPLKNNKISTNKYYQVKGLFSENYSVLKKEIEDNANKWRDTSFLWFGSTYLA